MPFAANFPIRSLHFLNVFLFFSGIAFSSSFAASPIYSSERMRNLKQLETTPLLFEYHRMTTGTQQMFYFPRRDSSWRENFAENEKRALIQYRDAKQAIAASLVGGIDYRGGETLGDTIWPGLDGGLYLRGYRDSVEFMLDARIYVENHSASYPKSFDREFVEFQKEENNSGVEYASYARYRGMFAINMGFGRLMLARDVFHFGPGYYNNLTLNQYALPYNTLSFEFHVGPLSVISLYGDLRIYANSMNRKNTNDRNLYAHRYELNLGNLILGMSETQILYNENKVWLFVPIVPLFMEKGNFSPLQLSSVAKSYYEDSTPKNVFGMEKYVATDGNNSMFVKSDYEPVKGEAVFYIKRVRNGVYCQLYKHDQ